MKVHNLTFMFYAVIFPARKKQTNQPTNLIGLLHSDVRYLKVDKKMH